MILIITFHTWLQAIAIVFVEMRDCRLVASVLAINNKKEMGRAGEHILTIHIGCPRVAVEVIVVYYLQELLTATSLSRAEVLEVFLVAKSRVITFQHSSRPGHLKAFGICLKSKDVMVMRKRRPPSSKSTYVTQPIATS
jgi:hypothetical protein